MFETFKDFLISFNNVVLLSFFYVLRYFESVKLPKNNGQKLCHTVTKIDKIRKTRMLQNLTANKMRYQTCKSAKSLQICNANYAKNYIFLEYKKNNLILTTNILNINS